MNAPTELTLSGAVLPLQQNRIGHAAQSTPCRIWSALTGTGNFRQIGGGTTILTNINTYQGGTLVSGASTLQVGSGAQQGSAGTGAVEVDKSGTLLLVNVNGNVFPNNVSNIVAGASNVLSTPTGPVTTTVSGALTDSGGAITLGFTHFGTGTTVLTNAGNTYSGSTTVTFGTLQIGTAGNPSLPSTMESELAANPFLRSADPALTASASRYAGQALTRPVDVFAALRKWKDGF